MARNYPLDWPKGWPRLHGRKGSLAGDRLGTIDVDKALRDLENEIHRIPARGVVVTSNWGGNARRGEATVKGDPGVAVYFTVETEQLVMAQDAYSSASDNARSLRIAINGMRALKRHGGDLLMKRAFAGFAALPPPSGGTLERKWWEVLGVKDPAILVGTLDNGEILTLAEMAYRKRAKELGGQGEEMAVVNAAIEQAREALK